jgi:hypothetical protein
LIPANLAIVSDFPMPDLPTKKSLYDTSSMFIGMVGFSNRPATLHYI